MTPFDLISLAAFLIYASAQLYLNHRKPKRAAEKLVEAPKPKTRYEAGPGTTSDQSARELVRKIEAMRKQHGLHIVVPESHAIIRMS